MDEVAYLEERAMNILDRAALFRREPGSDDETPRAPPAFVLTPSAPAPTAPEFVSLADFIAQPPQNTYLIKSVLPARGMAQIFGSSNVGKSFLAIDLAMHVALGRPWRGFKTKKACVLYIAAEGLGGLAGRMKAWCQRYGETPELFFIRPYSVELTVAGTAAALAEKIQSLPHPPRFIILDTLAANFGPGNENDAQDMAVAMNALRTLSGDWLAASIHHSGHGDKTRSRGHSSLYAAMDIELQVTRDDPKGPIKVTHTKCRDFDRMDPLFFALESEPLPWADEDGDPLGSAVLVPLVDHVEAEREKALSGSARVGLDSLRAALMRVGVENHADAPGVVSVDEEAWRKEFYALEPDKTDESRKKSFQRARKSLSIDDRIKSQNGRFWISVQPRNTENA
jgi:hypothetical protein